MSEPFEIVDPVERFLDARKSVAAGFENPRQGRQIRPNQALWLAGAAVFAISTLILVDALSPPELASDTPSQHQVSSRQPGSDPLAVPAAPGAQSVHAIDPTASAARSSESQLQSQKSAPVSPVTGGQQGAAVESSPSAQLKDQGSAAAEVTEADPELEGKLFKITSAVRIRNGPSASADIIGMAYAGTVAHVASRDSGWTQIVDPSSGKMGWIDSTVLSPLTPTVDMASTEESIRPAEDQDAAAMNKPSMDQGVELPNENALPAAKAKKNGSKRHYARRGFPFRFALRFFRR